jgi:hypothetical protein
MMKACVSPNNSRNKPPEVSYVSTFSGHCRADAHCSDRYWRFTGAGRGLFPGSVRFKLFQGRLQTLSAILRSKHCQTHIVGYLPLVWTWSLDARPVGAGNAVRARVIKNTQALPDTDRAAMADYLKSLPPVEGPVRPPKAAKDGKF